MSTLPRSIHSPSTLPLSNQPPSPKDTDDMSEDDVMLGIDGSNPVTFRKKSAWNNIHLTCLSWTCFAISVCVPFVGLRMFEDKGDDFRFKIDDDIEIYLVWLRLMYFPCFMHILLVLSGLIPMRLNNAPSQVFLKDKVIHFTFVSRGTNRDALFRSVSQLSSLCKEFKMPKQSYTIRVLIETDVDLEGIDDVVKFIIPNDYVLTYVNQNRQREATKYKARALHYMTDVMSPGDNEWIVHLDEETVFGYKTLNQLCHFVSKASTKDVGQGIITYDSNKYRGWQHMVTTLADSMRTSIDASIFRLQFMFGVPIFGIKGSFIVVNAQAEKEVGFNYGHDINITEDAFFALMCWDRGFKFHFIPAIMKEQSPHSFSDFIKQRCRWLTGLSLVSASPQIQKSHRRVLKVMVTLWKLSIMSWIPLFITFFISFDTLNFFNIMNKAVLSVYIYEYLWGTVIKHRDFPLIKCFFQVIFVFPIPLFPLLECMAILRAMCCPDKGFHIVQKN